MMKKVVFSSEQEAFNVELADNAMIYESEGNEVTFVICNESLGICPMNMGRSSMLCKICREKRKNIVSIFPPSIKVVEISDYIDKIDLNELKSVKFDYNSIDEIKQLQFHRVHVGLACLSTYIYKTRNLNPLMDDEFKMFFDAFLNKTCYLTLLQEKIIEEEQPDEITFFNGRFSNSRTLIDLAKNHNIHSRACDGIYLNSARYGKLSSYDSMLQNLDAKKKLINDAWNDESIPLYEKEQIGRWFFESKINQRFVSDTNYVKGQHLGKMPKDWDDNKTNYVIFNSSEDEFCAIDESWEKAAVFKDQIEGINFICKTLGSESPNVHIYLRIHPNLRNIKYRYHTDLLSLPEKYQNITVIDGNSDISSYSLMAAADKVIVFGSTIGLEASYAGKPVINLAGADYGFLNATYNPSTKDEFKELLVDSNLKPLDKYNCLKYGYFILNPNVPNFVFYTWRKKKSGMFFKKKDVMVVEEVGNQSFFKRIKLHIMARFIKNLPLPTKENTSC